MHSTAQSPPHRSSLQFFAGRCNLRPRCCKHPLLPMYLLDSSHRCFTGYGIQTTMQTYKVIPHRRRHGSVKAVLACRQSAGTVRWQGYRGEKNWALVGKGTTSGGRSGWAGGYQAYLLHWAGEWVPKKNQCLVYMPRMVQDSLERCQRWVQGRAGSGQVEVKPYWGSRAGDAASGRQEWEVSWRQPRSGCHL